MEDPERSSSEPVGKWRSNGEALEPKWRDGDYIPLLPFSYYRSYTRDEVDDAEDFSETSRRPFKYRYSIDQSNRLRGSPDRRGVPPPGDYDEATTYRSREKQRPSTNPRDSLTLDEETIESAASNDGKRGYIVNDDREATSRYREAFQARPDEYEHEFDDEEYMKPRPRKRRPPQNYEFALANEASSSEENEESKEPSRLPNDSENPPVITRSSDSERENALELKSLLKMQQEEGSSLSEILQRRNLSLSDLLKGKADVINALKSRIADESDEYIEEMSRVMSNSLMKLAATVTPSWRSTTIESNTTKITVASNISDNSISRVMIVPHKVSENYDKVPSNDTNRVKEESQDAEDIATQFVRDSLWRRMASTTPPIVSPMITTSTLPPVAVNSMEYFLNDDGNAGSMSDRVAKFENLDEDEIMEFSDFTDFKKGKSQASEKIISQQSLRDIESTLSIEQILNPTERIEPARYRESDQEGNEGTESNSNKKIIQDNSQSIPIGESASAEDYNTFIEAEYQNDAPISEEDHEKQNKMEINPSVSQTVTNPVEKQQIENPDDDIKKLYDKNHSTEYNQMTRLPIEETRNESDHMNLKNHQGAGSRYYEEVVSEIEPEARAEIFELFASGSAGKRLERLLKSRNMSVEELIALRQRGSSKVHLTEVSRLRITKPQNNLQTLEASNTNNKKIIIQLSPGNSNRRVNEDRKISEKKDAKEEKAEESMTQFIKQDIMTHPFFDKNVENMSMSRLLDHIKRDKNASRGTFPENNTLDEHELQNSRRTEQIVDLLTTFDSLPFVKNVQRQFDTAEIDTNKFKNKLPVDNDNASVVVVDEETKIVGDNSSGQFHAGYVKEVVREEPNVIDIRTIYGEAMSDGEEKKTLSQMKPSIIASGAILGVTIVVFLAIFIVCRIRQKQKYTYRNTFSRAVFQNPVMMARKLSNSSSLSTVMVNVVATSTTKRPERTEMQETVEEFDKSDIDNDSLDGNDSWETIPDYAK